MTDEEKKELMRLLKRIDDRLARLEAKGNIGPMSELNIKDMAKREHAAILAKQGRR